jgi:hypothetical protein
MFGDTGTKYKSTYTNKLHTAVTYVQYITVPEPKHSSIRSTAASIDAVFLPFYCTCYYYYYSYYYWRFMIIIIIIIFLSYLLGNTHVNERI